MLIVYGKFFNLLFLGQIDRVPDNNFFSSSNDDSNFVRKLNKWEWETINKQINICLQKNCNDTMDYLEGCWQLEGAYQEYVR